MTAPDTATQTELDALRAQRNREADAVAHLNGLLAASQAEVQRLMAETDRLRADIARLEELAAPPGGAP